MSTLRVNGVWSCIQPECIAHAFHTALPVNIVRAFNEQMVLIGSEPHGK